MNMSHTSFTAAGPDEFRMGMRRLAAAVNVISTESDGELYGMLATAVCSVSAEPPTLLVCVNKSASACEPIAESKRFCVNVLSEKQQDLANQFLNVESTRRLDLCKWTRLATGAPAIEGSLVSFDCEVDQVIMSGTHAIFIGRVVVASLPEAASPLLYFDGAYSGMSAVA
ncbi:flavin reductase family protein [Roseovarius indicus]|uniref:flavin reductase family protein n=1 Tax=Roseovarius indicus TaxID=540747 RepID=UPI0032F010CE